MNSISKHVVPWIKNLDPYNVGKPIQELAKTLNVSEEKIVKLASNENPLGMSPKVHSKVNNEIIKINRYPDSNSTSLKKAISDLHGVTVNQIFLGNGSNDVLECLAKTFLRQGTSSLYSKYSFAVYSLATISSGANSIVVPSTKNLGHDLSAFLSHISSDTKLIFIANPNNPTGSFISRDEIKSFLNLVDESILVVLDEAYYEYLDDLDKTNSVDLLKDYPNLFITRSFSKAYGLAGLRVGYGLGNEEVISFMNSVRQPFNVNCLAQMAAIFALEDQDFVEMSRIHNRQIMLELVNGLSSLGIKTLHSRGNFVLANFGNQIKHAKHSLGIKLFEVLLSLGVITRPVTNYDLPNYLRISVGTEEENKYFLKVLPQALDLIHSNSNYV